MIETNNSQSSSEKTRQLAKNTIFLYIRMIVVLLVSLYTSRVVLNTLGFNDFGIYNVVAGIVVFLNFLQSALRNATFRYTTYEIGVGESNRISKIFSMSINAHVILSIAIFFFLELIGVWFLNNHLNIPKERIFAANWVFQLSLVVVCISIIRTPFESLILAYERMDFYAIISVLEAILKLTIAYVLLIIPFDKLISYTVLLAVVSIALLVSYIIYCFFVFKNCRYIKIWDNQIIAELSKYSGWSMLVNSACMARSQCITVFFNIFLGVIANAALGIANQVISAMNMFVTNFTQAFNPQIVKSWANQDYEYFMKLIFTTSKISYVLLMLISVPFIINIEVILSLWLGEHPPMTAIYIESIIIYYLIDAMQAPLVNAVHATANLKLHQSVISIIVVLYIPLSYFMLKAGVSGSFVLMLNALVNLFCAIARVFILKKLINLDISRYVRLVILPLMKVTIVTIPIIALFIKLGSSSLLFVVLTSVLFIIFLCVATYFLGLNRDERLYVTYIFKNIKLLKNN